MIPYWCTFTNEILNAKIIQGWPVGGMDLSSRCMTQTALLPIGRGQHCSSAMSAGSDVGRINKPSILYHNITFTKWVFSEHPNMVIVEVAKMLADNDDENILFDHNIQIYITDRQ